MNSSKEPTESKRIRRIELESSTEPGIFAAVAFVQDGVRLTEVEHRLSLDLPRVESIDDLIDRAKEDRAVLLRAFEWHFLLPWLETPTPAVRKFWKFYKEEAAAKARFISVFGPKVVNRQQEQLLIKMVAQYQTATYKEELIAEFNEEEYGGPVLSGNPEIAILALAIVDWVVEAVTSDHEAPKRLHELLTKSKSATSDYEGQPTLNDRIFSAFIQEVLSHWNLPTKRTVRKKAGLGDENTDLAAASRAWSALGLSGLPEG